MSTYPCLYCGKPNESVNYCDWTCHVSDARRSGGREHLPNSLPVMCVKANGDMLECEHGDHPDYIFPVTVEYVGPRIELPPWDDSYVPQLHTLIYTDCSIAVTLYECCYAMWSVSRGGENNGGILWKDEKWKLSEESLQKIWQKFNDGETNERPSV